MGCVLKAWHLQLDEPVAVKFLLPELAASEEALVRFEREARATFKIKSEHVVRVLDVGRLEEGHPFMVMEYLEGEELADQIYEGEMPIGKITDIVLRPARPSPRRTPTGSFIATSNPTTCSSPVAATAPPV